MAPLFDPNNKNPWTTLPVILCQWEKDSTSPSGWSYRTHNGLDNYNGISHLVETYCPTFGLSTDEITTYQRTGVVPLDSSNGGWSAFWRYQSDLWKFAHPYLTSPATDLFPMTYGPPALKDGELVFMPPPAVDVAMGHGLQQKWDEDHAAATPVKAGPTAAQIAEAKAMAAAQLALDEKVVTANRKRLMLVGGAAAAALFALWGILSATREKR